MNALLKMLIASLVLTLAGCSPFAVSSSGAIDYQSARRTNPLEVPPDLMRLEKNDNRYDIPGSASAIEYASEKQAAGQSTATALQEVGDVQIKRDGNQRWLVVKRAPADLWAPVKTFWEDNGFVLAVENRKLGIMETDWAENRANIPQDPIRKVLGKFFDALYSSGQLDRFRTRLEKNSEGGTDIFISQRGMEEIYTATDKSTTSWQPRPNDPALEDELLRRMMIALGVSKDRATTMVQQSQAQAQTAAKSQTRAVQYSEATQTLVLAQDIDRAWRRVGLSLDRIGFTVEERDRNAAVYFVRYVPFTSDKQESKGWFSRTFRKKPEIQPVRYRVNLQAQATDTQVRVLTENGQPADTPDSTRILKLLADDLSRVP